MRLKLEKSKYPSRRYVNSGLKAKFSECEPFVENKRGILIHRPRSVDLYNTRFGAHIAVHYYCGGSTTDSKGKVTFLTNLDDSAILCAACEARAVMAELPSAYLITGKHVHVGKLKAVITCCNHNEN